MAWSYRKYLHHPCSIRTRLFHFNHHLLRELIKQNKLPLDVAGFLCMTGWDSFRWWFMTLEKLNLDSFGCFCWGERSWLALQVNWLDSALVKEGIVMAEEEEYYLEVGGERDLPRGEGFICNYLT